MSLVSTPFVALRTNILSSSTYRVSPLPTGGSSTSTIVIWMRVVSDVEVPSEAM